MSTPPSSLRRRRLSLQETQCDSIIDGAKALAKGIRDVFGDTALIQRCTLHKRRNVKDHLPEKDRARIDARLAAAFSHPDPDQGLANARALATEVAKSWPEAAGSIREGLEEMFTVRRLGVKGRCGER